MIARIWKGSVRQEDGDAYAQYLHATGVAGYKSTPGNRGVWMLRRDVGDTTEFMMFTLWESLDAVKGFAGDGRVLPRGRALPGRARHDDAPLRGRGARRA